MRSPAGSPASPLSRPTSWGDPGSTSPSAFPHVISLLDDAIATVAGLDEPAEVNYLRAHATADHAAHGDWRRATTRIFGSKPGAYGAGLLPLIDAKNWHDDAD